MPTECNRWYLLQISLLAQHVSGTIMPIIRRSRVLYRWSLPVVFGAVKVEKVICRSGIICVLALSVVRCICCCRVRRVLWGLCVGVGIMVPETCWASNKICNKYHLLHLVGILLPHTSLFFTFHRSKLGYNNHKDTEIVI